MIVDDLSMGAVSERTDVEKYAVKSIEGGGEILLFSNQKDYLLAYEEVSKKILDDEEFAEIVGERVFNVLEWKREYLK